MMGNLRTKEIPLWVEMLVIAGVLAVGLALAPQGARASNTDLRPAAGRDAVVQPAPVDMIEEIRGGLKPQAVQERVGGMQVQPDENKWVERASPGLSAKEVAPEVLAQKLGYGPEACAKGCWYQETVADVRLLIGEQGVMGFEEDTGKWISTVGWEKKVESLIVQRIASGDYAMGNSYVAGLVEDDFVITDLKGEKVGTNVLAYWMFYVYKGQKQMKLVPVVVEDNQGRKIANASGWHGLTDFDADPEAFFRKNLYRGKDPGPVLAKGQARVDSVWKYLEASGWSKYPVGLKEQLEFWKLWLSGVTDCPKLLYDGINGEVVPVFSFTSYLSRSTSAGF